MARYSKESLQQLKSKIILPELLSQHIELKRSGAAYKALCPFHDEKSPSFTLQRGDSHYHCFGCGAHGDAIQFLMQHLRMSFSDAVQHLAERFQVPLEQVQEVHDPNKVSRKQLKEALEAACTFYQFFLLYTNEGKEALEYLYNRGITLQFISSFRIGLAPKQNGLFRKFMKEKGFHDNVLEQAGLATQRSGRFKEFFIERITFPIQDALGAVIGFSARKIREEVFGGKYINTVETELFKKSKVLFGLHHSRKRIAKERQAIIVEGQLDALRLIFNGFDFTVAGLGTAFGQAHVQELLQLGVARVFLLLDGDTAGREASLKIGHLFQKEGVEVLVAKLEMNCDPDSLLLKKGPVAIVNALSSAEEYLIFLFEYFVNGAGSGKSIRLDSPAEKNQLLQELSSRIRQWDNPIMVHESLKKLCNLAKIPEDLLGVGSRIIPTMHFKQPLSSKQPDTFDPDRILESDLLRWLILCGESEPYIIDLCRHNLEPTLFRDPLSQNVYCHILESNDKKQPFSFLQLTENIDDEELGNFLAEIIKRKVNREKAESLVIQTIQRIKERNWLQACEEVKLKIHSGHVPEHEILTLVQQFDTLKRNIPKVVLPQKDPLCLTTV